MANRIKAVKMYMCPQSGVTCPKRQSPNDKTVWVLPNDHAYDTYDQMVKQVARAMAKADNQLMTKEFYQDWAEDALAAIGIKP